jgi:hypothetical protein
MRKPPFKGVATKMRDLYEVAKDAASAVVSDAQCAGYDISTRRELFFASDRGNLADAIYAWLEAHMEPTKP